ncbi:hypothetical protein BD626DRAFT_160957 [Schizophyllum amplum]|uniref:Macrofage activating glycoprotein n=1 Tax=Schizophyllum amplum TaxID=97359 RepID=A0A550CP54_9AGAR|nr:hypothetical protein BD626DRAFT_160957 [Auriculariopsis ampla]
MLAITSTLLAVGLLARAQGTTDPTATYPATALADKRFDYPDGIPYKSDEDHLIRGIQVGYNLCNSTTEGPESNCQTSFVNSVDDFCLWGPPEPNSRIGDTEGETVAWCTKPGRGTRLIPPEALKGVQFMKTDAYVQVVGFIDQTQINIQTLDYGGEMDPHGADLRGNPLGGLMYTTAFGDGNTWEQVIEWHNFMGSDMFCIKACDQSNEHAADFCEHIYDRIGCAFNAPNNAQNGTFESCEGDVQDYPGVYTDTNGEVSTYTQPPEGVEPTLTWAARTPSSSNCVAYTSSELFSALASDGSSGSGSTSTSSRTGSSSGASGTTSGATAGASGTDGNGASSTGVVSMGGILSVAMAVVLLA